MPLGTLDRNPPPMFKQGLSAVAQLTIFSALAIFLMVADTRLRITEPLRALVATVLHPVQRALLVPVEMVRGGGEYMRGLSVAIEREHEAERKLVEQAARLGRIELLEAENARLRALLELRPGLAAQTRAAEVLYDAPDPYTRKIIIDKGATQGVVGGSPVIDETGVLGQVTRVYPLTSEVTLLIDKDAIIPVFNTRTQVRGVAYGDPTTGGMELRYMATNADVREGDELTTSGVDGVYPAGLAVARVTRVDQRADTSFAKILLSPVAMLANAHHVLVVQPVGEQLPPPPPPEPSTPPARRKPGARP